MIGINRAKSGKEDTYISSGDKTSPKRGVADNRDTKLASNLKYTHFLIFNVENERAELDLDRGDGMDFVCTADVCTIMRRGQKNRLNLDTYL
jgi:hypothetical protein